MITKVKSSVPGCVHIIFELPCCQKADHISLIGEFNDWNPSTMLMQRAGDGVWRIELDLPAGRTYEFRYLVDDRWLTDSHADGQATNPYGTQNSIVDTTLPIALVQLGGGKRQEEALFWQKAAHLSQVD